MQDILNITNGDSALGIMRKANIPGVFLPWQDVLHEGPVPAGLSLEELSKVRADFIINRGWGTPGKIKRSFIERDHVLKSSGQFKKVILWFEHDLYDQLQLLQLLDWFHQNRLKETQLSIICTDQYLGTRTPAEMADLIKYEKPVNSQILTLSNKAWSAFRSDTPQQWYGLLNTDTTALPFLEQAITRLLEEYPACANGLSRTAQQVLKIVGHGVKQPGILFRRYQQSEERMFMGDSSFWIILHELLGSEPALLELPACSELTLPSARDQELAVTAAGKDVLSGKKNWLDIVEPDRWLGGVHLKPGNTWCWDSESSSLVKTSR